MNKQQQEGMKSSLPLSVNIECYGEEYAGFVNTNRFYCLYVTQPYETKIDAIYELTGFLTHLKDEADKCLNELFTEKCEILISNEQKVKRTKK